MRTRNANTRVGMQHKYINLSRDKLSRDVLSRDNRSIVKKNRHLFTYPANYNHAFSE